MHVAFNDIMDATMYKTIARCIILQKKVTPKDDRMYIVPLLPVPHSCDLRMPHLLLQLENAVHERLGRWWTSWNINIYGHNPVATSCDRIAVVIISAAVRTATHRNDPPRVRHLIVDLSEGRCHLVCECACHNHNVGLTRRCAENDTETILIVTRC